MNTDPYRLDRPAVRDQQSAAYFDALHSGNLLIRRCAQCDHRARPDAIDCDSCAAGDLSWAPATGRAQVVVSVVDHTDPDLPVLALVELEEGPWIMTRLVGCDAGRDVPSGRPVVLKTAKTFEGEPVPVFVVDERTH